MGDIDEPFYREFDRFMPETIEPMTVEYPEDLRDDGGWASEIKWDGVRAIAFCQNGKIRLQGIRQNDLTDLFPELEALGEAEGAQGTVLDGELVSFGEGGVPDFRGIQDRLTPKKAEPSVSRGLRSYLATFVIFDLLWADGQDFRERTYQDRRRELEARDLNGLTWQTPEYLVAEVQPTLDATAIQELEGLVVKRLDSPYVSGRMPNPFWFKLKNKPRQEFIVGGWIPGDGLGNRELGGLLLGYWDHLQGNGEVLKFAGAMVAGFSEGDAEALATDLEKFEREDTPFEVPPSVHDVHYLNPLRVVEVEFREWDENHRVVDPVFIGMRRDKDPGDVRREPTG